LRYDFEVPFPFRDYLYGKVILFHLDKEAETYLMRFIEIRKARIIKGDMFQACRLLLYASRYGKVQLLPGKNKFVSRATTDRDREADVELHRPYLPLPGLLKARYLVQGGYYAQAKELLLRIDQGDLN